MDLGAVRALVAKDLMAIRRSKAVVIPMLGLPFILMVLLPLGIGLAARGPRSPDVSAMLRIFVPTTRWLVLIFWVTPAVAAFGLGAIVRVSARARTAAEANQLSAAVVLPLIFATWVQATGLLLIPIGAAIGVGVVVWLLAAVLLTRGAKRFTRDRLAAAV